MAAPSGTAYVEEDVQLPTGRIHLFRGGAGTPLVVLHHDTGTPGWTPFYDHLAKNFQVYVPELPGYGSSEGLEWARHPRDLAAVLQQLLDRLNLAGIALVGLGFGGWLAAEIAVVNQRRLAQLVLVGAAGVQPAGGEIFDQMMVAHDEYVRRGFSDQSVFERLYTNLPSAEQQLTWDINREVIARVTWKPYMISFQLPHLLAGLTVPSLVVWGRSDDVIPLNCGERYRELIPGAELAVVEQAGHYVDQEQPAELASQIARHAQTHKRASRTA